MNSTRRRFVASVAGFSIFGTGSVIANDMTEEAKANSTADPFVELRENTTIIGHRGVSGLYEDNSLHGFDAGMELGVDGFEIDIRYTSDDVVVLSHDPHIISDFSQRPYLIQRNSYETLKSEKPSLLKMDTFLSEMHSYDTYPELYIGVKNSDAIEPTVTKLESHNVVDKATFCSFEQSDIERARQLNPALQCGLVGFFDTTRLHSKAIQNDYDYILPHYNPGQSISFERFISDRPYDYGYWLLEEDRDDLQQIAERQKYIDILMCNRPDLIL